MSENTTNTNSTETPDLFGRRRIYTTVDEITADNLVPLLNELLSVHIENMYAEEYLYWYRRGLQPILERVKEVRPEINNKVVENHASEIVAFKNGYFLTQPAFYVSRRDDTKVTDKVNKLNEYLYLSGKQDADNAIVDWFHTVGIGVCYVEPSNDNQQPFRAYALDPRSAFVVYSRRPGGAAVMGVNIVLTGEKGENNTTQAIFDVFTRDRVFRVLGGITGRIVTGTPINGTAISVVSEEVNTLGEIPIIEYQYENNRMSAFESVIPLLDEINKIQSNRVDGIEQFIQSLMVFYNCQLGTDENGKPIDANYIRQNGMLFLRSTGQDKADLKILSEQLNQTEVQVLIDYLYERALSICGMPTNTKGGTSTSDTGQAVLYRDGWYQADTFARNTADLFKAANRRFDRIITRILKAKGLLDINISDFEIQFTRNETANILVKTQAAMNMRELGFAPEIAFQRSGVSNDPVADVANSKQYIEAKWGKADNTEVIDETVAEDNAATTP